MRDPEPPLVPAPPAAAALALAASHAAAAPLPTDSPGLAHGFPGQPRPAHRPALAALVGTAQPAARCTGAATRGCPANRQHTPRYLHVCSQPGAHAALPLPLGPSSTQSPALHPLPHLICSWTDSRATWWGRSRGSQTWAQALTLISPPPARAWTCSRRPRCSPSCDRCWTAARRWATEQWAIRRGPLCSPPGGRCETHTGCCCLEALCTLLAAAVRPS